MSDSKNKTASLASVKSAISNNQLELLTTLVKSLSVDELNAQSGQEDTPLILAAFNGNVSACRVLVEWGQNPDLQGRFKQTALMKAAEMDKFDVITYLIGVGASMDVKDEDGDKFQRFSRSADKLNTAIEAGLKLWELRGRVRPNARAAAIANVSAGDVKGEPVAVADAKDAKSGSTVPVAPPAPAAPASISAAGGLYDVLGYDSYEAASKPAAAANLTPTVDWNYGNNAWDEPRKASTATASKKNVSYKNDGDDFEEYGAGDGDDWGDVDPEDKPVTAKPAYKPYVPPDKRKAAATTAANPFGSGSIPTKSKAGAAAASASAFASAAKTKPRDPKVVELELLFLGANKRVDEKLYAPAIKELAGMGFDKVSALEAVFSTAFDPVMGAKSRPKFDAAMQKCIDYLFNRPAKPKCDAKARAAAVAAPGDFFTTDMPIAGAGGDAAAAAGDDHSPMGGGGGGGGSGSAQKEDEKYTIAAVKTALDKQAVGFSQQLEHLVVVHQRELKRWEENTYSWALMGATVAGAVTPKKLAAVAAHQKAKSASEMQHLNALASIGFTVDDYQKMVENAADIEKRIEKVNQLLEAKQKSGVTKGVPLASILAEMSSTECVVCLDAISDQIFLPCNHICACVKCADLFRNGPDPNCPRCRTPIEQIKTVRFAGI